MAGGKNAEGLCALIHTREYFAALDEARRLRNMVRRANLFTLGPALSESEAFFSRIALERPDIYGLLRALHTDILSAALKKTGLGAIVD